MARSVRRNVISLRMRLASVVCLSVCIGPLAAAAAQASPVWQRSLPTVPGTLQSTFRSALHTTLPATLQPFTSQVQTQVQRIDPVAELARRLLALSGAARSNVTSSVTVPSAAAGAVANGSVVQNSTPPTAPPSTVPSQGAVPSAPSSDGPSWSATVVETGVISRLRSAGTVPVVPANSASPVTVPGVVDAGAASPADPLATDRDALIRMLAGEVGDRAKVDAAALELVWRRTDERRMRAVLSALAQVGTPYRAAGNQPGGFDCSGLTSYAWSQAGVKIPRSSGDQINAMSPRTFEQLLPGDIVWHPGHVGMYLGVADAMVHSPQTGKTVEVRKINRGLRFGSPLAAA